MVAGASSRIRRAVRPQLAPPLRSPQANGHRPVHLDEAAPMRPDDVLYMQRTVGNQQVLERLQRLTPQPAPNAPVGSSLQRKETQTGLKPSAQVTSFATDAVAYFKIAANK